MQTLATTKRALGDRLILTSPTTQVRRVFELAGLVALLTDADERGRGGARRLPARARRTGGLKAYRPGG